MFYCATCRQTLDRMRNQHGVYHVCEGCRGRLVGLGVLRKTIKKEAVNRVWRLAYDGFGSRARPCPVCATPMSEVSASEGVSPIMVDVCRTCHVVWFDGGELDAMPEAPVQPEEVPLSPRTRTALAIHKVEAMREQADREGEGGVETPDEWWKWILACFSLPVELRARLLSRWPVLTYGLAAVMLLVFAITMPDLSGAIERWGYVPGHPFRYGGLTMLLSCLLHGGVLHVLGNIYFLLIFGDDVEEFLGPPRMAMMLVIAAVAGCLFHTLAGQASFVPVIGASGAISSILCFYSLLHPHARIGLLLRYHARAEWIGFSARTAFVLWILWQFIGMQLQFSGFSHVSALAHLGGVLVGILAWVLWRDQ